MRRWLVMLAGVAAIAVTGTALAMTAERPVFEKAAPDTTAIVEETTAAVEKPAEPDLPAVEKPAEPDLPAVEKADEVGEGPDLSEGSSFNDHWPPRIEILYPEEGQVFESHEVVFEGTSERHARVVFGDKEADTKDDGSWRIVLDLDEGENHITAKAFDRYGNEAKDSVTVIVEIPKKEQPKEEPKDQPKEEPKDQPKEEPTEQPAEWEFSAHQAYGECSENPPYDVFYGTGKPGSLIVIEAEFARKTTEVGENGEWEVKVVFEEAPVGEAFPVYVVDKFGHEKVFEFIHTG